MTNQSTVLREYEDGHSLTALVEKWEVSPDYVRARLDDWGVKRRTTEAAREARRARLKREAQAG